MLLSLCYHSKLLKISVCVDEAFTLPALSHLTVTTTILFNQQLLIKQLVCNKYGGDWAYEQTGRCSHISYCTGIFWNGLYVLKKW